MGRVRVRTAAGVLALAACSRGVAPPAPLPPAPAPVTAAASAAPAAALTSHYWHLVEYTRPGRTEPVRVVQYSTLRFERDRYFATACNDLEGQALVRDGYYEGRTGYAATQMMCGGPEHGLEETVARVLASPRVEWRVDGAHLLLRDEEGRTLRYEAIDAGYPDRFATLTVASGTHRGWTYRLYSQPTDHGIKLGLALRDAAGKARGGSTGEPRPDDEPHRQIAGFAAAVAGDVFVGGYVPATAVRVTHRRAAGAPETELTRYPAVVGSVWQAYGGVVAEHPRGSVLTAYGRDGRVLASYPKVNPYG